MRMLIIPQDRVEKLRAMEFPQRNRLNPIVGELNDKPVYFLQAELKDNPIFTKALLDFEASEIKEIDGIETKYYDANTFSEITDIENTDISTCILKTILITKEQPESKTLFAQAWDSVIKLFS